MNKQTYPIGTVLWSITGRRKNDEIQWYAKPECIEYADERRYICGNNHGGSWGNIGRNVFLTREECLEHFLERNGTLVEKIGINDMTPEGCCELPRTDWKDYEVVDFDGVNHTSVYQGFFDNLINVTSSVPWKKEFVRGLGMAVGTIKLKEIYEYFSEKYKSIAITVIVNAPLRTEIFQCGNYEDGKWVKLGEVMGYA